VAAEKIAAEDLEGEGEAGPEDNKKNQ